jgi:hypothetical protein
MWMVKNVTKRAFLHIVERDGMVAWARPSKAVAKIILVFIAQQVLKTVG